MAKLSRQDKALLEEAKGSVKRLRASLNAAPRNAWGEVGRNHYEAIARWEATIRRIEAKAAA